jgi:hypothetical protein
MTDVPKPLKELKIDIEDMMETARAIQGEGFANLVTYIMNSRNLIKLTHGAIEMSIQAQENLFRDSKDPVANAWLGIIGSNTSAFAEALDLTEKQVGEAMAFVNVLTDKVNNATSKLEEEDK